MGVAHCQLVVLIARAYCDSVLSTDWQNDIIANSSAVLDLANASTVLASTQNA